MEGEFVARMYQFLGNQRGAEVNYGKSLLESPISRGSLWVSSNPQLSRRIFPGEPEKGRLNGCKKKRIRGFDPIKGQLGVPLTMYPWYLLDSLGILGD